MKELTIGDVARHAGIQTSAIRYYESVGLLSPPKRVNGRRYYDPSVLQRLGLIQLARQAGFRISELQVLFTEPEDVPASTRWQALVTEKVAEMEALIERAQMIKKWLIEAPPCQCVQVDDCAKVLFDNTENGMSVSLSWGN
ncbi:MAG: MerR family transcriptional regulator [Ktedonobacteraceae bacterium]|nr:MerR family transcriptional regulator [Ktedonobacteraceae bacterium]MBV9712729.1 MerR family transcriptional regulator [Ktedonobacteraceae bacterium]